MHHPTDRIVHTTAFVTPVVVDHEVVIAGLLFHYLSGYWPLTKLVVGLVLTLLNIINDKIQIEKYILYKNCQFKEFEK